MFCCCYRDSSAYSLEESKTKPNNTVPSDANIQTGKGALSSSSQNIPTEANLDKSTVEATKREKSSVTTQPTSSATASPDKQPPQQPNGGHPQDSTDSKVKGSDSTAVELSDIEAQIIQNSKSETRSEPNPDSQPVGKCVSVITVTKQTTTSSVPPTLGPISALSPMLSAELVSSVNSELDKLDRAVGEAESKTPVTAKAAVPGLANQLKVLTSQVLVAASGSAGGMADKNLTAAVTRLEAVASRLEALASRTGGGGPPAAGDSDAVSPFVIAYDEIISGPLAKYISLSNDLGGEIKAHAALVKQAFDEQRKFLALVSKCKEPDQVTFVELLKPTASKIQAVQDFRESNRSSKFFNHLSAVSEAIPGMGWVTVTPAPGPFVKDMLDTATFYTNRVLKEYKDTEPKHVEWSKAWTSTFSEIQAYIKQYHTTGLSWNAQGGDAKSMQMRGAGAGAVAGGGAPPPPPPGPPPPPLLASSAKDDDDGPSRSALFAEINKGTDVTKGLRKVTDDMKTHKNPALRQGPAPFKPTVESKHSPAPKPNAKAQATPAKPPLTELQGKKWVVEYHKNNKNIVIDKTELKQSVYAFKCEESTIQVKGKVNSIILDSCKKTAIVLDDLVASLEFVNCQSMQAQVNGKMPTVSIDKTDGCMIYLSAASLDTEIVTAKSSEMNILVPKGDGDFKEFPLPEQYKTKYDGNTMVTTVSDSV